jgi:3-oxoadipate enol-lactonase
MQSDFYFLDPNPSGSPTVFLIHGLGADSEMWGYQLLALAAAGMRPVAMDIPGFGKTPLHGRQWRLKSVAKDLAGWMAELAPGKNGVVGLSMGGIIAQQLALDFPDQVERLVLASSFASIKPRSWKSWYYLSKRAVTLLIGGSGAQAEQVADHLFPDASQAEYHQMVVDKIHQADPRAYRQAMRNLVLFDSRRKVKKLNMRVLVITGQDDGTIPPAAQAELARRIPGAQHIILPAAGHAVNVDQVELFNQHLLAFLQPTAD